jgi:hypothetical protein
MEQRNRGYHKYFRSVQCKAKSLTLREVCGLRVLENWFLQKIFGPKRDEIKSNWRKQHSEELHGCHSSPNVIRVIK